MTKLYSYELYERWEFYGYKLYDSKELVEKLVFEYNENRDYGCKECNCCFARLKEIEINSDEF